MPLDPEHHREVKRQLRSAFEGVPSPGPDGFLDDRHPAEGKTIRDLRLGRWRDWRDVPAEVIERNGEALLVLGPEALRFFLPAYLTFALDHPDSWSRVAGLALQLLDPGQKPSSRRSFADRFSNLTAEQVGAIRSYLLLIAADPTEPLDADQARIAMERHWGDSTGSA